jgi:hypothetical protein
MATVPSVIGETVASAADILDANGFGFSAAYTTVGATAGNDGTAKSQSPGAGTNQPLFTVVTVTFYQYIPPVSPPSVSITATRTTAYAVSVTYSVTASGDGGTTSWSVVRDGSVSVASGSLSAGASTGSVTVSVAVTPRSTRYSFTVSASNNGGSVSATAFDLPANPVSTAAPSGFISVSQVPNSLTSLNLYYGIFSGSGTNVGRTYYTISGTGVPSGIASGSFPAGGAGEEFNSNTESVLSPGTAYTYTLVLANNRIEVTYTGTASTPAIAAPTNFQSDPAYLTDTSARLTWTPSTTPGVSYVIDGSGGDVSYTPGNNFANITNLSPSTQYTYGLYAILDGNESATVSVVFTTAAEIKTIVPTITAVQSGGNAADISWSTVVSPGISIAFAEVYGPNLNAGGLSGSAGVYDLSPGSTYTWYIDVYGTYNGNGIFGSDEVTLTITGTASGAPTTPLDFTARGLSTSSVALSWSASDAGGYPPVNYYISGPGTISYSPTLNNYATVTGLSANTSYTWSLYAQNAKPTSPNTSSTVTTSGTTLSSNANVSVIVPSISAVSNPAGTEATINWSTIINGATLYNIYAEVSSTDNIISSGALTGSQVVTGLTPGATYTLSLYVEGFKRSGAPVGGSDVFFLTMSNPSPPPAPTPISNKTKVYLNGSWNNNVVAVKVYNGSTWVAITPKTSDGQGHWT